MLLSELIQTLVVCHVEHGDVEVYFVNDQFEAKSIQWAGISNFADGASWSEHLGPVAEGDEDEYDEVFKAVELQ